MLYPSLFDSFFAPTRVIVVSEERLKAAEQSARKEQLEALDNRINELTQYRTSLSKETHRKLYEAMIVHEKPLTNALGEGFRDILDEDTARTMFERM